MKLRTVLLDAKKAVACGTSIEGAAVLLGLLDNAEAGYVTAALGAVSTALVYALRNVPAPKPKSRPRKHIATVGERGPELQTNPPTTQPVAPPASPTPPAAQ